jgi:cytochrome c peroxidase
MNKTLKPISFGLAIALGGCEGMEQGDTDDIETAEQPLVAGGNRYGVGETVHSTGAIDRTNPFFQALGANLRTCETCHDGNQGWTITASAMTMLFHQTQGTAPVFMTHDAGSRADADLSTLAARRAAFKSTVMDRALVRFNRTVPATAEFTVQSVADPHGAGTPAGFPAFRRPSPTANESKVPHTGWAGNPVDPFLSVASTSIGATRGHEQRVEPLPTETVNAMRDFQIGVVFAQGQDWLAGRLDSDGARGGAANLAAQAFYPGINDLQGLDPQGHPYTRKVFDIYDAWEVHARRFPRSLKDVARAAIYRGQQIFNNLEFDITGVPGLNDLLGQATVRGTCSTCHNTPNVGAHSVHRMFDIGSADPANCGDMLPLVTLQNKTTMATRTVCDMGRATGTGKWDDLGRFRAPPLRGLAARAPYFHDGQHKNIREVIEYFDRRFNIGLTFWQKLDLEAFLAAL